MSEPAVRLMTAEPAPPGVAVERDLPEISVVVIGRNEGQRLARCLESVRSVHYPSENIDLIYVDSASTDASREVAQRFGARVVMLPPGQHSAAMGRNAGLRLARFKLIQFLDGDTILNPGWLHRAATEMQNPDRVAVFGRVEEVNPRATVYNFWAHHDWYVRPGPAETCGGIVLFRTDALLKVDGFNETLIAGEESDLCFRIKRELGVGPLSLDAPMVLHDINMTRFRQYWKRCVRTGHCYAEVAQRDTARGIWRQARWRNIGHVLAPLFALVISLDLGAVWPMLLWFLLLAIAVFRNAIRVRPRIGTLRGAILYSSHHYIAKLPMAIGQCGYWLRQMFKLGPRRLIEYRA